jgi:hypothetical protein
MRQLKDAVPSTVLQTETAFSLLFPSFRILTATPPPRSALSSSDHQAVSRLSDLQDESGISNQNIEPDDKDPEWITVDHPLDSSDTSPPPSPLSESKPSQKDEGASRTYIIPSDSNIPSREVKIHILPRETAAGGTIIACLTRQLVEEKVPPEGITQEMLDTRIRRSYLLLFSDLFSTC